MNLNFKALFINFLLLSVLSGCAGYKYIDRSNPLAQYGIKSISLPMFYNQSVIPNTAPRFTKEFSTLLSSFNGLKVVNGFDGSSDAVLLGVITSEKTFAKTVKSSEIRIASSVAPNAIGNDRNDFYIPASSKVKLTLKIILLKKPTREELRLFRSKYRNKLFGNKKVIFNETIIVSSSFNREAYDNAGTDVNMTQNLGALSRTIDVLAAKARSSFREMVLYAF